MKSKTADLLLLITAIFWGFGYIGVDVLLSQGMNVFLIIGFRFLIAFVVLAAIFFRKLKYSSKEIIYVTLTGMALFCGFLFQTISMNYTSTTNVSFITSVNVVFVPLIMFVFLKRKLEIKHLFAIALTLLGLWILTGGIRNIEIGDIITLIGAFFFALHIVFISIFSQKVEVVKFSIGQMLVTSLLAFLFALVLTPDISKSLKEVSIPMLIFVGLFPTALCFFLQNIGLQNTDPSKGSIILGTEALWGAVFAIILLGEPVNISIIIGGALMLSAILIDEIHNVFKKPKI